MVHESQTILVVDDLSDWRSTLRGLLGDAGYKVEVATSLSGAIRLFELQSFALALIDMRLDESDEDNTEGLVLAEEIRRHWPLTKIITITGYDTPERLTRAMAPNQQGNRLVDDYISKTQTEDLIGAVKRVLIQ